MHSSNDYTGALIALCTTICWSISAFPFADAAKRFGANTLNHFRLPLAVLFLWVGVWLIAGTNPLMAVALPSWHQWMWLGVSGLIGLSLGDYFGFASYAILGARISSVFSTLAPGAALLFGFMVLSETINMIGIIGMSISLGAIVWLSLSKNLTKDLTKNIHGSITKGIFFAILSAICQGVGLVLAKKGLLQNGPTLNPIHASWMRMFAGTVLMLGLSFIRGKLIPVLTPAFQNKNKGLKPAVIATLIGPVAGASLSVYAVQLINASVAQTIFSLMPVTVLPVAWFVYKEKISLMSVISGLIAIIGVVILVWRNEIAAMF